MNIPAINVDVILSNIDWITLVLALFAGIFVKLIDEWSDREEGLMIGAVSGFFGPLFSAGYGVLLASVVVRAPVVFPLIISVLIAMIVCGKIDSPLHSVGLSAFLFVLFSLGAPGMSVLLFLFFFTGAMADEIWSDYADGELEGWKARDKLPKPSKWLWLKLFESRLMLEFCALAASIVLGSWTLFLTLLCFDAGYKLVAWLAR